MAETEPFTIGAEVSCTDGVCGDLRRVIVDPVARAVTHLVVRPKDRLDLDRLVPLDLVDAVDDVIRLRCSQADFNRLKAAEETQFIPAELAGYGPGETLSWPYYGLGPGFAGFGPDPVPPGVTYDTVPLGEVDVRRGERVHATDGSIGRVQGLVIDRGSHHVTHVLLAEGHLWGKKEVAIPIRAVASVDPEEGIRLSLSKQEVEDLPPVDIEHPERGISQAEPG
jgi:sporulation protein YlmC with PRC-barrel domain